jgi:hypothetical protein
MSSMKNTSGWIFRLFAILMAWPTGCAAPDFVIDGPFGRSLNDFRRIEIRPVRVALASANATPEQAEKARGFAAEFGNSLLHRLHRRGRLDAAQGPLLVVECRVLRYEWTEVEGNQDARARSDARIQVAVTFRDEAGTRIGSGTVLATGAGSAPHLALEDAGNGTVASVYKFIRKGLGRKEEKDGTDSPEPERVPLP